MEIITIDGMVEHDFRHSIEDMLRLDEVDQAVERLHLLLKPCAGIHEILPPRFLTATFRDVEIVGWDRLANRLLDHDRPSHPISAIGITLADARALGGPGPARGRLSPFIKTFYFSDDAYGFSDATRDDLLDGYSREGFEWQGDYQATDATLSIKGIDDLYGAIIELEDRLLASKNPPDDEIRAGTIGACFVATLIHQSLRAMIREKGLPRPLCILAACDGVYPFFDAPVAGSDECMVEKAGETMPGVELSEFDDFTPEDDDEPTEELPAEASLLTLMSRKVSKAPVIVLGEEDARDAARYSEMAGAQRLGVDEGFVGETADFGELGDNATMAASDVLDEPEPEPNDQSPLFDGSPAVPECTWDSISAELDPPDEAPVGSGSRQLRDEIDPTLEASLHPWSERNLSRDSVATDLDLAASPFVASASHSLRTRIKLAPPDRSRTLGERIGAILDKFSRLIFRR